MSASLTVWLLCASLSYLIISGYSEEWQQQEEQMAMRRRLGKTDIEVTPVGLGCWQFSAGQGLAGKFWEAIPQSVVDQVVEASLAGGINWFDTAEMYGNGASERALAAALRHAGKTNGEVVVATKWSPIFRTAKSIRSHHSAAPELSGSLCHRPPPGAPSLWLLFGRGRDERHGGSGCGQENPRGRRKQLRRGTHASCACGVGEVWP